MGIDKLQHELSVSIRARYPILYVVSWEESRIETALKDVAARLGKQIYFWACTSGFDKESLNQGEGYKVNPALDRVVESPERAIFVFKDLHSFLEDHRAVRKLRDVADHLRRSYKTLVILSPVLKIPVELEKDVTVFDAPLPDMAEMDSILRNFLKAVDNNPNVQVDWASSRASGSPRTRPRTSSPSRLWPTGGFPSTTCPTSYPRRSRSSASRGFSNTMNSTNRWTASAASTF
ncbi:MAG: hypothetical protein ACYTAN_16565 [Planctomycetota bacterium]|jgi:hypothetical protein